MLGYIYKLRSKHILIIIGTISACYCTVQIILRVYFNPDADYPVLMWWTPFMGEHDEIISCLNRYNCLLTGDKKHINNTNLKAFLFYGSQFEIKNLPVPKDKIWALFHEESPRNVALFLYNRTYELFEIVSTFSRHSDLPLTLQYLDNLSIITDTQYMVSVEEKNKLLNDIAPVLYVQSDCDTPVERDAYVSELMKYIPVDSYGSCLNNRKFPKKLSKIDSLDLYNGELLKFVSKYKFAIAFENAVCQDYVTEKLWRPLLVGTVPIYLGSPSVEDWLPNKNSAILAKHFQTPAQLAGFLNKINKNDSLYEKFRKHKYGEIENGFLRNALAKGPFGMTTNRDHPIPAFECFVCQMVYEGVQTREAKSVYDCPRPNPRNSWEHHWRFGDCQSKALVNSVKNNVKLEVDPC